MKAAETETITPAPFETAPGKINYINHLKVVLTVLVILHHAFITYGAPGGWYYQQKDTHMAALFPMVVFVATNQSFFMGFFFFLSALFTGASYKKKGTAKFLADRLKRLGIPLVFYSLILSPLLNYMIATWGHGKQYSLMQYLGGFDDWIDFGVLWFVAALLIFNFLYLIVKSIPAFNFALKWNLPSNKQLLIAGLVLGLFTFFTRLVFPTGWTLQPLGFQLGHFPQYITLFIIGLVAAKNNWLNQLSLKQGKKLVPIIICMVTIILPAMFVASLITKTPPDEFNGGWNPFVFSYSLWEQLTGIMIMMALLSIAKFKWNAPSVFMNGLSASAFGVYIFHPVVLVSLSLLVKSWDVDPAVKLVIVGPSAVVLSFFLVPFIRKIPGVGRIIQ